MSLEKKERWQTKTTNLKQGISHIYKTKEFSDVTFQVQGQWSFPAHRLVLSARSAEFARLLLSPSSPEDIIIDEDKVTKTGFGVLLHFMYNDTMGTTDKKAIIEGYLAACHFKLTSMLIKCEDEFKSWVIKAEEVCELLNVGTSVPVLKEKCMELIKKDTMNIISSPSFHKTSLTTLSTILLSGALDQVPTLDLIENVMKWGANHHREPVNYSLVREDLLNWETPLLGILRFEKLSLEQLSRITDSYSGLLTAEDVMKFVVYKTNRNALELPKWCAPEN